MAETKQEVFEKLIKEYQEAESSFSTDKEIKEKTKEWRRRYETAQKG